MKRTIAALAAMAVAIGLSAAPASAGKPVKVLKVASVHVGH